MLEPEDPGTQTEPTVEAPRRRRAASRPAGPPTPKDGPAPVAATTSPEPGPEQSSPDAVVPAPEPVVPAPAPVVPAPEPVAMAPEPATAPEAEAAPAAAVTPRRRTAGTKAAGTRRAKASVADATTAEASAVPTEEGGTPPVEVPSTPRRRRSRSAVSEASAELPAAADVAESLHELVQAAPPRRSSRTRVKAETFGLTGSETPDQVLDSLAAAIGGRAPALPEPEAVTEPSEEAAEVVEAPPIEDEAAEDVEDVEESLEEDEEAVDSMEDLGSGEQRRRRRRRGGRRRRRSAADERLEAEEDAEEEAVLEPPADDAEPEQQPEAVEETGVEGASRRRRRRRRRGEDITAAEDDPTEVIVRVREPRRTVRPISDEVTGIEGSTRMEAKRQRRREGRAAGRRRAPILSESEFLARRESVDRKMLVRQGEDYVQIAVLEDGVLVEHYVDRASATSMIGNIYLGRIQNVLPSMEAAFVDIGRGRNAVIYAGEVDWDSYGVTGQDKKVEKVFKSGQSVLVQVTKDPVGAKGARLTSHISIPGRYIVYSPGGQLSGISRKLPEPERKRLKDVLDALIGDHASVIVRTAAEGASEEELVRDVNRLKAQWEVIEKKAKAGQAPQLLYSEPDLTVRIVRDLFTEDFGQLVVDGNGSASDAYDTVEAYVSHVAPHLRSRLVRWDRTDSGDLFAHHRVHEQVAKALERKVFLPSGGSLIIDRTEAMTVIDVNTGKFTGTSGNLEATVTSNNLEAAEEIVRQLRLRDIGGIIVIDFIDMVLPSNRELLLRRLVECLGRDRTRHQVAEVTSLGLVQMTRKKIGTGLAEAFTVACETCKGRGYHVHDAPVASQAPADGGDREHARPRPPARSRARQAPAPDAAPAGPEPHEEPTDVPPPGAPSAD